MEVLKNESKSNSFICLQSPMAHTANNRGFKKNILSAESELVIYSDAPKCKKHEATVRSVRCYIKTINQFKKVTIIERENNLGLANSIIDGVTNITNQYGKVIVLEDDLVTSPYFLTYMNNALDMFANDDRIISVHGYVYPVEQELPEAFFLPGADCWGWATWKRGWKLFNSNGQYLLDELRRQKLVQDFDFNNSYPYSKMLKGQVDGTNDSWAIRWYASAFLADKLTLYPGRSLVQNIGNDNSGTHCGGSNNFDSKLTETKINLKNIVVEPSKISKQIFEDFFEVYKRDFYNCCYKRFLFC